MSRSSAHDDCSWTCEECGGKVLNDHACMGCWDECDAEEPMKSRPDDGLCRECNPRPHGKNFHTNPICVDGYCECEACCKWDELRSDRKMKVGIKNYDIASEDPGEGRR